MHLLIDADILVYRTAFGCQKNVDGELQVDPPEIALEKLADVYSRICGALDVPMYTSYLSATDGSNFRLFLDPNYKNNRAKPKPVYYQLMRDEILKHYNGEEVHGQEADDQLGIECTRDPDNTIIVSIDKDLDQIPGWHYNFLQQRKYIISPLEAMRCFYIQCLVGDMGTDNIPGCPSIGEVKANRILEGCQDETEMLEAVVRNYRRFLPEGWLERLHLSGNLLWVRKKPEQKWSLTNGEVVSKEILVEFSKGLG